MKIAIVGAGSFFTKYLVNDILSIPNLPKGEFVLIDKDEERLGLAEKLTEKLIEAHKASFGVRASLERKKVLSQADFVINQIEVHGLTTVKHEFEIPLKYGVDQCIGDTLGPGGLFKTLRTLPDWMEILGDIERYCPSALILNYTNPMSAITLATRWASSVKVVGLCHSVQGTTKKLAQILGVPYEKLRFTCGGINHMAWITQLSYEGDDMYPVLRKKLKEDPELYKEDPVRFNFFQHMGVFVTESSGHFSEYVPYYRKRKDLVKKHCAEGYNGGTGFYAKGWPSWRATTDQRILELVAGKIPLDLTPSQEYAAVIIDAMMNNKLAQIYGNVENTGLIPNLPFDGIVEVACSVDATGVHPQYFGPLPTVLAALNRTNMQFFSLLVEAFFEKSRCKAKQALMLDPLTAAVCSLDEIDALFEEIYHAEREYLPELL